MTSSPTMFSTTVATTPGFHRIQLGDIEVVIVTDGARSYPIEKPFIRNASIAEINAALAAASLEPETMTVEFNAVAVKTGASWTLIDTGNGAHRFASTGRLPANLDAAGITPEQIEIVLISHFHPDHINGLRGADGSAAYPQARIKVPAPEWDYWMDDDNQRRIQDEDLLSHFQNARRVLRGLERQITPFRWGDEVGEGIQAVESRGHTPGHTSFVGDAINQPALYVTHPDWQPKSDVEAERSVQTRWRLLEYLEAEGMPVIGFHFPFPSLGRIEKRDVHYCYVPSSAADLN
jgi:glyoxylase-like metal-dependent hydrolase (beta-lactamase superfamily II)